MRAIQNIMRLPDNAPPELVASDPQLRSDFVALDFVMEQLGSFVYTRNVDLHDADRTSGGFIRGAWGKVRAFVEAERANWPNLAAGEQRRSAVRHPNGYRH